MYNEQRDIDQLADRLDAWLPAGSDDVPNSKVDDPLMRVALALARAPKPEPSLDAMARIQLRMLAANKRRPVLHLIQPFLVTAASVILVLFFISPLIARSVPGEPLYGIKRGWERVEVVTADIFSDEVSVRMDHAAQRAQEAVTLIDRGEFDPALVAESLEQVEAAAQIISEADVPPSQRVVGRAVEVNALLEYVVNEAVDNTLAAPDALSVAQANLEIARNAQFALLLPPVRPPERPAVTMPLPTTPLPARATPPVTFATSTPAPTIVQVDPSATPTRPMTATAIAIGTAAPTQTPLATGTPEPQATPLLAYAAYINANDVANIREGPGTNFPVLATAEPNTPIQVIGQNDAGNWFNITLPNGTNGWIADFLVQAGTPPPANAPADDPDTNTGSDPGNSNPPDDANNPPGNPGDFGCDKPGNSCNAPGQQNNPGN